MLNFGGVPGKIGIFIDYVTGTLDTKKWRSLKKGSHLFVTFSSRPVILGIHESLSFLKRF